jgi:hypothetical protein
MLEPKDRMSRIDRLIVLVVREDVNLNKGGRLDYTKKGYFMAYTATSERIEGGPSLKSNRVRNPLKRTNFRRYSIFR